MLIVGIALGFVGALVALPVVGWVWSHDER